MLDTLTAPIDLYCERTGPEYWSEPVNAMTNLAFVLAGLWGVYAARRHGSGPFVQVLAWWVVAIGVGSWLFHTHANRLTIWADIIPIATFVLAYTVFALRRFGRLSVPASAVTFVLFYAAAGLLTYALPARWHEASNGTAGYLPAFLAFLLLGAIASMRRIRSLPYIAVGFVLFLLAAFFRMIDPAVCEAFPIGTHFLWHVFNAAMLLTLLAAAVRHGQTAMKRDAE